MENGRTLIVASDTQHLLRRWRADTGEPIGSPIDADIVVPMLSAAWLHGDPVLITPGDDETVRRWHAITGELLDSSLPGVAASCTTDPGGTVLLATGTFAGEVTLHYLAPSGPVLTPAHAGRTRACNA